jgi:DNA (cytosine-5)-methyltransferase 1
MTEPRPPFRVLSLFAGIGGFDLGLERTGGFRTVAFCEIDPFCRRVLAKHWPEVPCYEDVRTLTADTLARDGIGVDVICGGFPCQDISTAGIGAGLDGERSGLWSEIARLAGELRPRYVIVENVAALLGRGLDRVLGDLAEIGFDAEWHCIPASAVGAPHRRDRVWIVANPHGTGLEGRLGERLRQRAAEWIAWPGGAPVADAPQLQRNGRDDHARRGTGRTEPGQDIPQSGDRAGYSPAFGRWDGAEPDVGRVAYGVPKRVDRLRALGNAVVPQIPELIGRAILASEAA